MWNLLTGRKDECSFIRGLLEDSAGCPYATSVEELLRELTEEQRAHFDGCPSCRDAALDLLAAREIFREVAPNAEEARPWFAARVMSAIAERERELSAAASAWLAVPKFASRLALASGAVLLVASTWLYERPYPEPAKQPAATSQEYLFEAPAPPMNQDDVLLSMAEMNP
jgi:hypothetical protein